MTTHIPANPVFTEFHIADIQTALSESVLWLTNIFGKSQDLTQLDETGKRYVYPAAYVETTKLYESMLPDAGKGNFCFFIAGNNVLQNPEGAGAKRRFKTPLSIIFFMDLEKVNAGENGRNLEAVKLELFNFFDNLHISEASFRVESATEKHKEIYKNYTLDETANQNLMQPYAGLSFDGTLSHVKPC